DRLWFTPDGLEQATRPRVAARRAARLARTLAMVNPRSEGHAGVVVDLGCGIGADALAFAEARLVVVAVERDEGTAVLASANLGREVIVGEAEELWPRLAAPGVAVFADPARRTASGRTWRVEDLSPGWPFVESLLDGTRVACVKLGPGVPHALIPDEVEAEWVSDAGTVVECCLWAGPGAFPGRRRAVVDGVELVGTGRLPAEGGPVGEFLYEPDGAVVRAGLVDEFAGLVKAHRLAEGIAYLSAPWNMPTPFATVFAVREVMSYDEKILRAWVRDRGVGTLEIKKRGLDVDPAELRRRLRPRGKGEATLVLAPTRAGAVAIVCQRVGR
ncbi:MAG: THUMP-like domain-containing protein, partial [Actinomycetes bacterium]